MSRARLVTGPIAIVTTLALATPVHAAEPALPPPPSAATPQTCAAKSEPVRGEPMLKGGIALTVSGLAIGLLIGGPALLVRSNARRDAKTATYETDQRFYARRVARSERAAAIGLGIGGVFILAGVPLIIAGARIKRRDRASVTPVVTPTMAGLNARLRF